MKNNLTPAAAFGDTKPHYELLDGMRGVAAILVIWYHIYECFFYSDGTQYNPFMHGYLGVDFFFVLSGFVIGYAYDDRWNKMGLKDFFKRRLIRLHPMVIMGVIIGVVMFCIQGATKWDGSPSPISWVMIAMLLTMFMIPAYPGVPHEVRGNGEMFPLNGPNWSLFFEYLANIAYALVLRKLSNNALKVLVALSAVGLVTYAVADLPGYGSLGVGWSLGDYNFIGGLLRVTFSFSAGLLLVRNFKPMKIRGAFYICSLILVLLFAAPFISVGGSSLYNSLYDAACIIFIFPLVVYLAASGSATDSGTSAICRFLGDISYPLYIVHYPSMYLFYHYIGFPNTFRTPAETWHLQLLLFFGNILLAYLCLKLYDEPVRHFLTKRFLKK